MTIQTRNEVDGTAVRYTATFTADQIEKAKTLAKKRGHSVSQVIRDLVAQGLLCEGTARRTTEVRIGSVWKREFEIESPMFADPKMEHDDYPVDDGLRDEPALGSLAYLEQAEQLARDALEKRSSGWTKLPGGLLGYYDYSPYDVDRYKFARGESCEQRATEIAAAHGYVRLLATGHADNSDTGHCTLGLVFARDREHDRDVDDLLSNVEGRGAP